MHIADTLLHLRKAGHPEYIEWFRSFACNDKIESDLQSLNQKMKDDLHTWSIKVFTQRKTLYVLNYFTSLQLLQISNELYRLIIDQDRQVNKKIFLLLMSISPDLTTEDIKNVTSSTEAKSMCSGNTPHFSDGSENFQAMDETTLLREVDKLTDEEKELYRTFTEDYSFNASMVLTAIRRFGSNEDEIENFCSDPEISRQFGSTPFRSEVEDGHKTEKVDVNNVNVQELINKYEYSESLAIAAVKKHGEDIPSCLDYCADQTLNETFKDKTSDDTGDLYSDCNIYKTHSSNASSW